MKIKPVSKSILFCFLLFSAVINAQTFQDSTKYAIQLRSGSYYPVADFSPDKVSNIQSKIPGVLNKQQFVIQFEETPNPEQLQSLKINGIEIVNYVSGNAYTVITTGNLNAGLLSQLKTRALFSLAPQYKMQPELFTGSFPVWAVKNPGTIDLLLNYPSSFNQEEIKQLLAQKNIDIISFQFAAYNTVHIRMATNRMEELAAQPYVLYLQAIGGEEKTLLNNSRQNSRGSVLSGSTGIGKNLQGNNITIGVGDEGAIPHIDFEGRRINRNHGVEVTHSNHVSAIAAGAGVRAEHIMGHAPKATIVSQLFSGIINNAPAYVSDHQMVITNNSWGVIAECSYHGIYDFYSSQLDQLAFTQPNLQNVFAAGNLSAGNRDCPPYPINFRTVYGAHQSAKNILTVGGTDFTDNLWSNSCRGPVRDGRIKPEVVAQAAAVWSASTSSNYSQAWGTSQSAPVASGTLALMYERYKQLNGGVNPPNGLMKAIISNTADDKGNPGPDFSFGFGRINGLRAVEAIESNRYLTANIANGGNNPHNITIPANTAALKVMLYWNDPAAALISSKALVNNLDLTVTTTTPAATYLPLILDHTPAGVNLNAVQGVDTLNNIEQVTILNPDAGTYTINIAGTAVPIGAPQQYFITYDIIPVTTTLTSPTGGERIVPGENFLINWDSHGGTNETFDILFSTDNFSSTTTLASALPANTRQFVWSIPAINTKDGQIRVIRNTTPTTQVSTSAIFTILGSPAVASAPTAEQCEGYIKISWPAVTDATGYEVMKLSGSEMQSVAILPNTSLDYTFSGLSKDTTYWVTCRAIINGAPGRRGTAIARQPNNGDCNNSISDNDIKIDAILSPSFSGRVLTSSALSNSTPLIVRIKNLDNTTSTATLTFSYSLSFNGGPPTVVTDPAVSPSIAGGATFDYTFMAPLDMSAVGTYDITFTVSSSVTDPVLSNNSVAKQYKQLPNPPVPLPFLDNMETASIQSVQGKQIGLNGLDRYDFNNSTSFGRLRTSINTGMAFSGTRAITLDAASYIPAGNADTLTGTFNMTGIDEMTQDIRLDFRFNNHGQTAGAANKVWVRGSDDDNWIEAYDLAANQNEVDEGYKLSASLEISDLLKNATPAQSFTSSFQVRWGQQGSFSAADNSGYSGYSFDDIKIYEVIDDIQLIAIDTPVVNSCNLSATTPVRIIVRNNSEVSVSSIPVRYRINGGGWISETIAGPLAANSNTTFTFSTPTDLSAIANYLIEAEVIYSTDSYHENDTLSKTITNTPSIVVTNTSPYLQGFEVDNGNWYTDGKNNSWEYGTPNSYKINRAANGSRAWKTRRGGNYSDSEKSYLYSPCFDISTLTAPTLSMSLALDLEDCGNTFFCDGAYVEYSTNGNNWVRLGANGSGTNWYNKAYAGNNLWSIQNYTRWHVATLPLSVLPAPLSQYTRLQFRIVVSSDALVTREGIAIDDIHIYSNPNGIYDVVGTSPEVTVSTVSGNSWINFVESGTNKIIASVNPEGLDLGSTRVQSFIHSGAVRTSTGQYYLNRNITIKPINNIFPLPTDSATVRFYFLDSESESLLAATGCGTCSKPTMAHELGVSKYSEPGFTNEDGVVENGVAGMWLFINSGKVKKIPYDRGYYAEYRVKDFSEFWLNNGGISASQPLPLRLIDFTAKKINGEQDVETAWVTASESNINRFEIEVAKSTDGFNRNEFTRIGSVSSNGNSTTEQRYSFIDKESNKAGTRYYRLRIIENDGKTSYSAIRPVLFVNDNLWTLQPNPSTGVFFLGLQAANGRHISINITDLNGKLVHKQDVLANGFVQKVLINLESSKFASGLYLMEATTDTGSRQQFKLLKQ